MGKAVITIRCWGTEDYVTDGKTGFFVDSGNADELRHRILYLMDNPGVAKSVGKDARQLIESKYNLVTYSRNVLASLKEACTGS